ncbi:hypothetical protein Btru_027705 [Bulinus truncatus]|nr:hypothetical protein Btru_027705 [Bulinus truncatus]
MLGLLARISSVVTPWPLEVTDSAVPGNEHQVPRVEHHLILLTYMRSGSSFVGALIGAHPFVFYMYEPLWTMRRALDGWTSLTYLDGVTIDISGDEKVYLHRSKQTLNDVFHCNFERLDIGTLTHSHMYRSPTTENYAFCLNISKTQRLDIDEDVKSRIPRCLNLLRSTCLQAHVRFVKVIESTISLTLAMMSGDPLIKVIHLVRDPRAILSSREQFGLFSESNIVEHSKPLCSRVMADILSHTQNESFAQKFTRKVLTLRYEDMAGSPITAAEQLYGFVNLDIGPLFLEMIWNMTYAGFADACNVCPVRRNATVTANGWRSRLGIDTVKGVQQLCRLLMDVMGFRTFYKQTELTDLHISATHDHYGSGLFKVQI